VIDILLKIKGGGDDTLGVAAALRRWEAAAPAAGFAALIEILPSNPLK
jgi:hypothetical protein